MQVQEANAKLNKTMIVQNQNSEPIGFDTVAGFEALQRIANMFAKSTLVPQQSFANNIGNCCIAVEMAHRLHMSPIMVMQNMYIVYGRPAWSSQFMIAAFNSCGRFEPIHYQTVGKKGTDSYGMKALSADLRTGVMLEGPVVDIQMAKEEGWYQKKGSKWQTMPDLMLRYRSATFLIRTTAPEISMGLTKDEVEDIGEKKVDIPEAEIREHANKKQFKTIPVEAEHIETHQETEIEQNSSKKPVQHEARTKAATDKKPVQQEAEDNKPDDEEVPDWMFES